MGGADLVIMVPITQADVARLCERVRIRLASSGARVIVCDVGALVAPDVGAIDALARLQLTARRLGGCIGLRNVRDELQELLRLAGLSDVMTPGGCL